MPKVLIVDNDDKFVQQCAAELQRRGVEWSKTPTTADALRMLTAPGYHAAIVKIQLNDPGAQLWSAIKKKGIALAAVSDIKQASAVGRAAVSSGAALYVEKPVNVAALVTELLSKASNASEGAKADEEESSSSEAATIPPGAGVDATQLDYKVGAAEPAPLPKPAAQPIPATRKPDPQPVPAARKPDSQSMPAARPPATPSPVSAAKPAAPSSGPGVQLPATSAPSSETRIQPEPAPKPAAAPSKSSLNRVPAAALEDGNKTAFLNPNTTATAKVKQFARRFSLPPKSSSMVYAEHGASDEIDPATAAELKEKQALAMHGHNLGLVWTIIIVGGLILILGVRALSDSPKERVLKAKEEIERENPERKHR